MRFPRYKIGNFNEPITVKVEASTSTADGGKDVLKLIDRQEMAMIKRISNGRKMYLGRTVETDMIEFVLPNAQLGRDYEKISVRIVFRGREYIGIGNPEDVGEAGMFWKITGESYGS